MATTPGVTAIYDEILTTLQALRDVSAALTQSVHAAAERADRCAHHSQGAAEIVRQLKADLDNRVQAARRALLNARCDAPPIDLDSD